MPFKTKYKTPYKSKEKIPKRYFKNLSPSERKLMEKEILKRPMSLKFWSADKAYTKRIKNKIPKSDYTQAYIKKYGKENAGDLKKISKATKIPLLILKEVYKRGIAAWTSGHRPGIYPNQWAMARVYSFVMGGKTAQTADSDLWEKRSVRKNPRDEELLKQIQIEKLNDPPYSINYVVMLDKKPIAFAKFDIGNKFIRYISVLSEGFKKRGIASFLWDYIERDQNLILKPGTSLSREGKLFWEHKRRKNPQVDEHNVKKRRKNPHADERYVHLLENAAHFGNPHYLSKALAYYNMGDKCDACDLSYERCQCEGSREHKFDAAGNVIQGYCKQCTTDYCICDYNIFNEDDSINAEKVKWAAKGLANRTLNFNQLKEFNRLLEIDARSYWRSISRKKLF